MRRRLHTRVVAALVALALLLAMQVVPAGAAEPVARGSRGVSAADVKPSAERLKLIEAFRERDVKRRSVRDSVSALAVDDNIPGVPAPASPVNGTLDEMADYDDVYSVVLAVGDTLALNLTGAGGTDFDLYLFAPGATDVSTSPWVDEAISETYPDVLSYTVPIGAAGTYYIDVYASMGSGSYSFTYTVTPGAPPPSDDEIPGVSLEAMSELPWPIVLEYLDIATDEWDVYWVTAYPGEQITFYADPDPLGEGSTLAVGVALWDGTATSVSDVPITFDEPAVPGVPALVCYTVPEGAPSTTYYVGAYATAGDNDVDYQWGVTSRSDGNIPGVTVPPSGAAGSVEADGDADDVYAIHVGEGQTLTVDLTVT